MRYEALMKLVSLRGQKGAGIASTVVIPWNLINKVIETNSEGMGFESLKLHVNVMSNQENKISNNLVNPGNLTGLLLGYYHLLHFHSYPPRILSLGLTPFVIYIYWQLLLYRLRLLLVRTVFIAAFLRRKRDNQNLQVQIYLESGMAEEFETNLEAQS
jgi:hypothetical protein